MHCAILSRLILDDIHTKYEKRYNVLGGGGLYAAYGMRMVTRKAGMVIKHGPDFDPSTIPLDIKFDFQSVPYDTPHALNTYIDNHRSWSLLTDQWEPFKIEISDFPVSWQFPCLHTMATIDRMAQISSQFKGALIWEPNPDDLNLKGLYGMFCQVLKHAFIASPNHMEALTILGWSMPAIDNDIEALITFFHTMAKHLSQGLHHIVLRCGPYGAIVHLSSGTSTHLPPYYTGTLVHQQPDDAIVDTTGCGNAFLGALAAYLGKHGVQQHNILEGCIMGTVASGMTLEQYGPPPIDSLPSFNARLHRYRTTQTNYELYT